MKQLNRDVSQDVVRRFREEWNFITQAKLESAHLVKYYDIDVHRLWLFMEYCPNGTLADFVDGNPLPHETVGQFTTQILLGLNALHDKGLLHRFVLPALHLGSDECSPCGEEQ